MKITLVFLGIILSTVQISGIVEDAAYWKSLGRAEIQTSLNARPNEKIAKNVILFVGDGMGLTSITTGRIYKGQLKGGTGEESFLSFEKFPTVGLLKTYNLDRQVPDSAATASAMFSGVKTNFYTMGSDIGNKFNVCRSDGSRAIRVTNVIDWAIEAKKSTGIVTNTRVTHATPAAAYANSPNRDWECDIPEDQRGLGCKDIASQLVEEEPGKLIDVVFAGGRQMMDGNVNVTKGCFRKDKKNLPWDWQQVQKNRQKRYKYVGNRQQLLEIDPGTTDVALGLFAPNHIPYDVDRDKTPTGHPSLEEMMIKAIQILSKNPNGFMLIVEGGRIDHAHHDNLAKIALEEVVAFDLAIETAAKMTKSEDTLIVVTADHSHAYAMAGYPKRGTPIGGIGDVTPDGFSYQTLSYLNGPGYSTYRLKNVSALNNTNHDTWRNLNLTRENSLNRSEPHFAGIWTDSETHSGTDVPVYASGPMAHLLTGVHEQTHVAFSIAYSACIGPYAKNCRKGTKASGSSLPLPALLLFLYPSLILLLLD